MSAKLKVLERRLTRLEQQYTPADGPEIDFDLLPCWLAPIWMHWVIRHPASPTDPPYDTAGYSTLISALGSAASADLALDSLLEWADREYCGQYSRCTPWQKANAGYVAPSRDRYIRDVWVERQRRAHSEWYRTRWLPGHPMGPRWPDGHLDEGRAIIREELAADRASGALLLLPHERVIVTTKGTP